MDSKKRRKKKGRVGVLPFGAGEAGVATQVTQHSERCVTGSEEGRESQQCSKDKEKSIEGTPIASLEFRNMKPGQTTVQETTISHKTASKPPDSPSQALPAKSSLEEELEWCIAQLELGMLRTGGSKSQKQQNQRSLQTLRGSKTPLPKKRQLMRSLFGDYRSKMKTQPTPNSLAVKETRLEAAKSEELEAVGTYYRHRVGKEVDAQEGNKASFKFNFNV